MSRKRYAEVVDALGTAVGELTVGDPLDDATQIGPLVAERQRTRVEGYIDAGKAAGARVVTGGGRPADLPRGWYVEPTVFADVDNSMKIAQEEIFGPVLSVIPYDDEDERGADRQRLRLRTLRFGVDVRSRHAPSRSRARMRTGVVAINSSMILDFNSPVRRVQEVGHRPRARPRGHRPLHRAPVDRPARRLIPCKTRFLLRTGVTESCHKRLCDAGSFCFPRA